MVVLVWLACRLGWAFGLSGSVESCSLGDNAPSFGGLGFLFLVSALTGVIGLWGYGGWLGVAGIQMSVRFLSHAVFLHLLYHLL